MARFDRNALWLPLCNEVEVVVKDFEAENVPREVLLEMFQNQIDIARESLED